MNQTHFIISDSLALRSKRGQPAPDTIKPEYAAWRDKADQWKMKDCLGWYGNLRDRLSLVMPPGGDNCELWTIQLRMLSGYFPSWKNEKGDIEMPPIEPVPDPNVVLAMAGESPWMVWWGAWSTWPGWDEWYGGVEQHAWRNFDGDFRYAAFIARNWAKAGATMIGLDRAGRVIRMRPDLAASLVKAMLDADPRIIVWVEPVDDAVINWWRANFMGTPYADRVRGYRMVSNTERDDGTDKMNVAEVLRLIEVARRCGMILCPHIMAQSGVTVDEFRGFVAAMQNGVIDLVVSRGAAEKLAKGESA